jgi:hypothetical protein
MMGTISGQDCFAAWAPDEVFWSQWAKPVAFAHAPALFTDPPVAVPDITAPGLPRSWDASAIVVDLPGEQAVLCGLALAERGFRPVPLFNGTSGPKPVVPMDGVERGLGAGAAVLRRVTIAPEARPAFLIDSERHSPIGGGEPGRYDNRWVVLPQDFPSATLLLAHGIKEIMLIRQRDKWPDQDLTHVLLRWRQAGLRLRVIVLETGETDDDLSLTIPSNFRKLWYGAIALMGLRRNNAGGFGSLVPEQTQHTGFYG